MARRNRSRSKQPSSQTSNTPNSSEEVSTATVEQDVPPSTIVASTEIDVPTPGGSSSQGAPSTDVVSPAGVTTPVLDLSEVEALAKQLRSGKCVLCAGHRLGSSGIRDLVATLTAALPEAPSQQFADVVSARPLTAAGFVRRRLGDRFSAEIDRATQDSNAPLSEAMTLFADLPFRAFFTTAYDNHFERALNEKGAHPIVYTPSDIEALRQDGKKPFVFKAFGDATRANTVIFSAEDLHSALADGGYRDVAQDLFRRRSFFFIGFEPGDPELTILLERVLAGARGEEHYAVLPGLTEFEKEELLVAYGIRVLESNDLVLIAHKLKELVGDEPILPDDENVEAWLELAVADPDQLEVFSRLDAMENRFRQENKAELLVELQLGRTEFDKDPSVRARRLIEVAQLFEKSLSDNERAFTALSAAFEQQPDLGLVGELERLAEAAGKWNDLATELERLAPALPEGERAELWLGLARIQRDKLGQLDAALKSAEETLKLGPNFGDARALRLDLLRKLQRPNDLAKALSEELTQASTDEKRLQIQLELGDLYDVRLKQSTQAIAAYREALALDAGNEIASSGLESLYRRESRFADLIALYDAEAAQGKGRDPRTLHLWAAQLCKTKLNDLQKAIERFEAILADEPNHREALTALESLYSDSGKSAGGDRTDKKDLLRTLERQFQAADSDAERLTLARRLADAHSATVDGAASAVEWLEQALQIDSNSQDLLTSLAENHRKLGRFSELTEALRRRAALSAPSEKADLFAEIGALYERELADPDRAIEAYLDAEAADSDHAPTLAALERLYTSTGADERAADLMMRRSDLIVTPREKVDLLQRAGDRLLSKDIDDNKAQSAFERALAIDAAHLPTMLSLAALHKKRGDVLKAARLLVDAVPHSSSRGQRADFLMEAAGIYDQLGDRRRSSELYLDALAIDPEHIAAAERVSEILWKDGRYQELVPILDGLTKTTAQVTPQVELERLERLVQAAKATHANEILERSLEKAVRLDPSRVDFQRERSALLFAQSNYAEAERSLRAVLASSSTLEDSERVLLHYELGACALKLGRKADARDRFAQALSLDSTHRPTLLLQVEASDDTPAAIISAKQALLPGATVEEQVQLWREIGDLYERDLKDLEGACKSFDEALALRAEDRRLLHRSRDVLVELGRWSEALDRIKRLIMLETDPKLKARYLTAAGLICRDELKRTEDADQLFSDALEQDATYERADKALEDMWQRTEDWEQLARHYRKRLQRLGSPSNDGRDEERLRVWSALGTLCLEKLDQRDSALSALEVAASLDRTNLDRQKQLSELYLEAGSDHTDKAIASVQQLLRADKQRVAHYRTLRQLYLSMGENEKAAACSAALVFLKKGEPVDEEAVAAKKQRPFAVAKRALNDEMWQKLTHPDEDRYLQALFNALAPSVTKAQAMPHKHFGLQRKEVVAANDARSGIKALRYIVSTLGLPLPELYVQATQPSALIYRNCVEKQTLLPSYIVGGPLLKIDNERELAFLVARHAAHLRPERILREACAQPAQIAHLLDAAAALSQASDGDSSALKGDIGKTVEGIRRALSPSLLEQVVSVGRRIRQSGISSENLVTSWYQVTDLTATRAALVLAGDLETTARLIAKEPASSSTLQPMQRLMDLIWSSVSEDIFAVQKHLGLL